MTPRERILAALRREETDYVPCLPTFWSSPEVQGYRWKNEEERLDVLINRLGVDALLNVDIARPYHPDVSEKVWEERPDAAKYPILHKVFDTPQGELAAAVLKTADWPHGNDIPLMDDFNVSRYVKPWLATMADVERFAYIWQPPDQHAILRFRERLASKRALVERYQVPTRATYAKGLSSAIQLFGPEQAVLLSKDQPEVITRLLEIQHRADMMALDILLDAGVDIVRRNGWYESTDFWNPTQFQAWVLPEFAEEVKIAHQAERPLTYTMCTGIMPLLPYLDQLEFDCLDTIEPVLGQQDMRLIVEALGDKKGLSGGVSAPMHIGESTPSGVRKAVHEAIEVFGKKGFILAAVPSIRAHWPWGNVMAMIEAWHEVRDLS